MSSQLTTRIPNDMSEFSKGQKLIAKYILEHYGKVAYMIASRLGAMVGVNESMTVHFATETGYGRYPEPQQAMQEMTRSRLTSMQQIEITVNDMGSSDVLSPAMNQDIDVICRTLGEASRKDFYTAVDAIADSCRIYISEAGSFSALMTFLPYYFGLTLESVQLMNITSEAETSEGTVRVNEADTVIGTNLLRYSKHAIKVMRFASGRRTKVIAITDSLLSLLAGPVGCLLLAHNNMASSVDVIAMLLSLINVLIVMVTMKKEEEITEILHSLEYVWDEYGVCEKVDEKNVDTNKP